MNTQNVQIGDLILRVAVGPKGEVGHVQEIGDVSHLGVIRDDGYVKTFIVRGAEIYSSVGEHGNPNRWAAIPPKKQWPQAMLDYIKTFPAAIQQRILVARSNSGRLHLIDRETLLIAWIKMSMIEEASFDYDPQEKYFGNGKPCIDSSWNCLVVAGEEVDLPEGYEVQE